MLPLCFPYTSARRSYVPALYLPPPPPHWQPALLELSYRRLLPCAVTPAAQHSVVDGVLAALDAELAGPSSAAALGSAGGEAACLRWSALLGREAKWSAQRARVARLPPYLVVCVGRFTSKVVQVERACKLAGIA